MKRTRSMDVHLDKLQHLLKALNEYEDQCQHGAEGTTYKHRAYHSNQHLCPNHARGIQLQMKKSKTLAVIYSKNKRISTRVGADGGTGTKGYVCRSCRNLYNC